MDNFLHSFGYSSLLISFLGGILIGIPTGPARFFVIDTSLNEGRNTALRLYAGLFCSIMIYAGLALLADDFISKYKKVESISYFIASILLIFWGGLIILKSRKENKSSIDLNVGSWFLKGFLTGISNPIFPFIYLAFIQMLKLYTDHITFSGKLFFIFIFEFFSFLTTSAIALIMMKKRKNILEFWRTIKIIMGILLIGLGAYNVYQQLDFSNGIKIKQHESLLEEESGVG